MVYLLIVSLKDSLTDSWWLRLNRNWPTRMRLNRIQVAGGNSFDADALPPEPKLMLVELQWLVLK